MLVRRILLLIALVAWLVSPAATSPALAHTPHDAIGSLVIAPADGEDLVLYTTSQDRLLRSVDGGTTWSTLVSGIPTNRLRRLAVTEADPGRVYVTSEAGLFRSDDRGDTWRDATGDLPTRDVTHVAVSPDDPDRLLLTTIGASFRSIDGGDTWQRLTLGRSPALAFGGGLAVAGNIDGDVFVSDDDGATWGDAVLRVDGAVRTVAAGEGADGPVLFAGDRSGTLQRSTDGGATWTDVSAGLPGQGVNGVALSPTYADDQQLWVSMASDGAYASTDGGATWEPRAEGLTTDRQADEINVDDFYGIEARPGPDGATVLALAGFDGPFVSTDGAVTWQGSETLADIIVGLGVSPAYADDETLAVATYVKGAYISTDDGASFRQSTSGLERELSAGNKLLPVLRLHNVVFSPGFAEDRTLFSASWTRLLRSDDGGESWASHFVSDPPANSNLRQFVIGLSPDFTNDGTIYLGTREGTMYVSRARGERETFEPVSPPGDRVRTIEFHPDFPATPTMFVSTDSGVLRSDDAGQTWTDTNGPTTVSLLSISEDFANDETLFAASAEGLLITRDGGTTWNPADHPVLATARIEGVETSPSYADDQFVLVSARGAGLYRSDDGGRTFTETGRDLEDQGILLTDFSNPTAEPIHFSPAFADDDTIFGYGSNTLVRSRDRGETWEELTVPPASAFDPDGDVDDSTTTSAPAAPSSTTPDDDGGATPDATTDRSADGGGGATDDAGGGRPWIPVLALGAVVLGAVAVLARASTRS